jgi:hypothetical protein
LDGLTTRAGLFALSVDAVARCIIPPMSPRSAFCGHVSVIAAPGSCLLRSGYHREHNELDDRVRRRATVDMGRAAGQKRIFRPRE